MGLILYSRLVVFFDIFDGCVLGRDDMLYLMDVVFIFKGSGFDDVYRWNKKIKNF